MTALPVASPEPQALYRFYDDRGRLLYVGITLNPEKRWGTHAREKMWWQEVASIAIEHHVDRESVTEAERVAIESESPRYNVQRPRKKVIPLSPSAMVMRSLRVPEDLWEQAKAKADAEDLNISDVVRDLLREWVDKK